MSQSTEITREMIALYDEYTHLTLDRRGFMANLSKLTGSAAAAAAIVPLLGADRARAAIIAPDDGRLTTERVAYPGAAGVTMNGYLAVPAEASAGLGAVIVVHENRGLNPHIEDVTRRVALAGFIGLAPDFLSPLGGTPADEDRAREMFRDLDPADTAANGVATIAYLQGHALANRKVGAIGFCWGGGAVNRIAVASPDLAAAVPYYGSQPADQVARIEARLMLHYAGLDERVNAGIAAFEAALKAAGADYQLFVYDGANHAFNNDTAAARYNKEAAELAWSRTVVFLHETLD